MKKLLFVLALGAFAASCGNGTSTEGAADSAKQTIDSTVGAAKDSVKAAADTAVKALDSTAHAAKDSVKAEVKEATKK